MTDRAPSSFVSGVLDSAWFLRTPGQVCRSTGFSLLADLKSKLRDTLTETGPIPTSGGTTIAAEQVLPLDVDTLTGAVTGDGWTTDTLRALYAVARRHNVSSDFTTAIQNDLQIARFRQGQPLSTKTMQTALWYPASGRYDSNGDIVLGAGSPAEVSFGEGTTFPGFGTTPEAPTNRMVVFGAICTPETDSTGAQAPLRAQSRIQISDVLIVLGLIGTAVGAALLTKGAPTREEQRAARRNPHMAFSGMTPPQRRYAIATRSRHELIHMLKEVNPYGRYTDAERIAAGQYPLTHTSASNLVYRMVS